MTPKKLARVNRQTCVACGACAKVCPRDAIQIKKGCYAESSLDLCIGCGLCAKTCPANSISIERRNA